VRAVHVHGTTDARLALTEAERPNGVGPGLLQEARAKLARQQVKSERPGRQSSTTMPRTTRTNTTRISTKARPSGRTRTVAYDVTKQLRTPKEMAAYLEAWLVEAPDDAVGIARAIGSVAIPSGFRDTHATDCEPSYRQGK
jgi:hypothetical protein